MRSSKPRCCCGWKYSGVISPLLELNIPVFLGPVYHLVFHLFIGK
jgi:hypothetical protein